MIHNLKIKIKDLWSKVKNKLIEILGGYTFPPTAPEIKADKLDTVKISATSVVEMERYNTDTVYRGYIRKELAHTLASELVNSGLMTPESVIDLSELETVVKVSATLVKEGSK